MSAAMVRSADEYIVKPAIDLLIGWKVFADMPGTPSPAIDQHNRKLAK